MIWTLAFLAFAGIVAGAELPRAAGELKINFNEGKPVSLQDYRGKVVLMAFISTTCEHCQHTTGILTGLQKVYGPQGFQVLAADFNEGGEILIPDFIKKFAPSFPVGYVKRATVISFADLSPSIPAYVPILLFIDRKGMVRRQFLGNDLFFQNEEKNEREAIETLLKEK
jgi:thiol-disulfide isomerase/thioredoxin